MVASEKSGGYSNRYTLFTIRLPNLGSPRPFNPTVSNSASSRRTCVRPALHLLLPSREIRD